MRQGDRLTVSSHATVDHPGGGGGGGGHGGHAKISRLAKLLIAMECPIYSFYYNYRYLLGPKGSFFTGLSAGTWTYYTNIAIFISSIISVMISVASDSYFSTYYTLLIGFGLSIIASILTFIPSVAELGSLGQMLNIVGLFWMCLYLAIEPLRISLFFDQLPHPDKMVAHQLGHVFLSYQEMKTLGSVLNTVFNRFLGSKVYGETPLTFAIMYLVIPILYALIIAALYKYVNRGEFSYAVGIDCIYCFAHALNLKLMKGEKSEDHWLETARDAFDSKTVRSTKIMSSVIFVYICLFSYGMTSSLMRHAWSDQIKNLIEDMDYKYYYIDIHIIYFVLTILFLPLIEYLLLPLWNRYRKPLTELQRIGITVFVTGISFISTTVVQLQIEKYASLMPSSDYAQVRIFNVHNEDVLIRGDWNFAPKVIPRHSHIGAWNVDSQEVSLHIMKLEGKVSVNYTGLMATTLGESLSYVIGYNELLLIEGTDPLHFGPIGTNKEDHVRLYLINYSDHAGVPLLPYTEEIVFTDTHSNHYSENAPKTGDKYTFQVRPERYKITCPNPKATFYYTCDPSEVNLEPGGLYAILPLIKDPEMRTLTFSAFTILNPAVYSAAILLPQICLFSFAEAMGKIPINVFMFKESPLELRTSSIAMYNFFRDSSALIFAIFHEVFRYKVDSFQLVLVTGLHMVFCFFYVFAALRHQKFPEDDMMKRRRGFFKSK